MGVIPTQRETGSPTPGGPACLHGEDDGTQARATFPGGPLAPGNARGLTRAALAGWRERGLTVPDRLADEVVVVVSELVTNAVVHAGTDVGLVCRLEPDSGSCVVEVSDRHPSRAPASRRTKAPIARMKP